MDKPQKEDYTRGVGQIELPQAIAAYYKALEKYCDFKDEMEVRRDLKERFPEEKISKINVAFIQSKLDDLFTIRELYRYGKHDVIVQVSCEDQEILKKFREIFLNREICYYLKAD